MSAAQCTGALRALMLDPRPAFMSAFMPAFMSMSAFLPALLLALAAQMPALAQDQPLRDMPAPTANAADSAEQGPAGLPAAPVSDTESAATEEGRISHYGPGFHGRRTACGSRFDAKALTMAHKTLPCGTRVRVTNLKNRKSVIVEVTDRGPNLPGRIGDLSTAAARELDMTRDGFVQARLETGLR